MKKPTTTPVGDFVAIVTPSRAGGRLFYRLTLNRGDQHFFAGTFSATPSRDVIEAAAARVQHYLDVATTLERAEAHVDQ